MDTGKYGKYECQIYNIIENEKDIEQLFNCLKGNILGKQQTIKNLREKINKIESDAYKDIELAKMKTRYEEMQKDYYRGFPISEKEKKSIDKWVHEHEKEHKGSHGAIGGRYTYEFTPTSIGTFGTIKCSCGESFDFQEL